MWEDELHLPVDGELGGLVAGGVGLVALEGRRQEEELQGVTAAADAAKGIKALGGEKATIYSFKALLRVTTNVVQNR